VLRQLQRAHPAERAEAVSVAHAQAADSPAAADPSVAADTALMSPRLLNVEAVEERLVARYPERLRRLEIVAHATYAVFVDAAARRGARCR
jgi:hypothetical protein